MKVPEKFDGVSVVCKANVFFDGKVVSHTVLFPDGSKKTLGLIFPCTVTFDTRAPEKMLVTAGACKMRIKGDPSWKDIAAGTEFPVPANTSFEICVDRGPVEYICSFG